MIVYNGWEIYVKSASKRIGPLVLEIHNIGNEYFWDLMPFETPSDDTWELHGKSSTFEKAQAAAEAMGQKASMIDLHWGVWITQDKPRKGRTEPDSYWWQGLDYSGDSILSKEEAEAVALKLQKECSTWSYEARPYLRSEGDG